MPTDRADRSEKLFSSRAAVKREELRATMSAVSARNADLSDAELERLVEEELAETRKTFWATHRR